MNLRTRNGASLKLPALFLLLAGLPLVALGWVGWQLLERDRALEVQRERERVENAVTLVTRELERSLAAWGDLVAAAGDGRAPAIPPETSVLIFDAAGVIDRQGTPVLFVPSVHSAAARHGDIFATAEAQEYREGGLEAAVAAYRVLAASPDPRIRADALMRLARCLRKLKQPRRALAVYAELAALGNTTVAGSPAELVARHERMVLLASDRDLAAHAAEARLLAVALTEGRFSIDRPTFELFGESVPAATPDENALRRAEAIHHLWPRWRSEPSGRATWTAGQHTLAAVWRPTSAGTAAIVGPIDALAAPVAPLGSSLDVDVALEDAAGRVLWGTVAGRESVLTRDAGDTGHPWALRVAAVHPTAARDIADGRRNLMVAGFGLTALLIVAAGAFVFRAVNGEIRVAQVQSDFLAAVSHEFRTPLTAMSHLTTMLEEGGSPAERLPQYYRALARETRRLHRLVESLLDFGRTDSGRRSYEMREVGVTALVSQVVGQMRDTLALSLDRLALDAPSDPCRVRADHDALALVVRNLLDNAIKYSPESSTVRVRVESRPRSVAIAVEDAGPGMSAAERRDVFRKFVRGSAARALNVKGTGIGLTMARQVVAAHGGELAVWSEIGRGSRFTVKLPAASPAAEAT
jgi:signal transduction histidine kinase